MKSILEKLYLFEWFDKKLLSEIEANSKIYHYKENQVIISQWEIWENAYVISKWIVWVLKDWKMINTIFEWDIFWEISLVTNEARTATIIAQTDVELLGFNKYTLVNIIKNQKNWEIIKSTILNRIIQNINIKKY